MTEMCRHISEAVQTRWSMTNTGICRTSPIIDQLSIRTDPTIVACRSGVAFCRVQRPP